MKLSHTSPIESSRSSRGLAAKGAVQVKVEHKLKVATGGWGGSRELDGVDVECVEALEHAIEGARLVGRGDHERGTVGAGGRRAARG